MLARANTCFIKPEVYQSGLVSGAMNLMTFFHILLDPFRIDYAESWLNLTFAEIFINFKPAVTD